MVYFSVDYIFVFLLVLLISSLLTFICSHFIFKILVKNRIWKNRDVKETMYGTTASVFNSIKENEKGDRKVLRMGGFIIAPTLIILPLALYFTFNEFLFLVFSIIYSLFLLVGFWDDYIDICTDKGAPRFSSRVLIVAIYSVIVALFLYYTFPITINLFGIMFSSLYFFVPFVIIWTLSWFAGTTIDGVDGLSSSCLRVFLYFVSILALFSNNLFVLLLCSIIIGALLVYGIYNKFPAKVYFTEVGVLPLFISISFILLILGIDGSNVIWIVPFMGIVFFITWLSIIVQILYRKKYGKKLFLIAPIHHHFEAKGYKNISIIRGYLLVTTIMSMLGIVVFLSLL